MQNRHTYTKTKNMLMCGLFAAVTGVAACVILPLPFTPVPVSLATLAVMVAGGVLGSKLGAMSMAVYVLIGAFGVPVFGGFTGGLGRLAGPTGGFLLGYVLMAFVVGFVVERWSPRALAASALASPGSWGRPRLHELLVYGTAMAVGTGACYGMGTGWFMAVTGSGLWASLVACVFPFVVGDLIKILAAAWLVQRLRKHIRI